MTQLERRRYNDDLEVYINSLYEKVSNIEDKVNEVHTVILGVPNSADSGLCGRVQKNEERQRNFEDAVNKEKAGMLLGIILALLAGVFGLIS